MARLRCQLTVLLLVHMLCFSQADLKFLHQEDKASKDPGDLADAEVEKIQLAEELDSDKTGATTSDSESNEDELDADTEARRSEMYEGYDLESADSFLQEEADQEDPGDLADAQLEKIQLAEELDSDKTGATTSDSDSNEDEFDADTEARRSEMYEGYDSESADSFLQEEADQEDPGDLADAQVEKIQLAEELDSDKTGATTSDSESNEDEFDADTEARRSEMYGGYDSESADSFLQEEADHAEEAQDDPSDLADAELKKIQLKEHLDIGTEEAEKMDAAEEATAEAQDNNEDSDEAFEADFAAKRDVDDE